MNHDPLDTCPYDPVHRILRSRMQFHLTRCSKNFPCSKKKQCPFDARHLINQVEFNYHVSTCPARESVWHYKIKDEEAHKHARLLPINSEPLVATDENWDDDIDVKSYNPLQNIQDRPVMRTLIGAPKAQRRKFRMEERQRIQTLEENNKRQEKAAAVNMAQYTQINTAHSKATMGPDNGFDQSEQEYKPLRRPKKLHSDSLNMSGLSLNSSIASNRNQKSTEQNKSVQDQQSGSTAAAAAAAAELALASSSSTINNVPTKPDSNQKDFVKPAPKTVPFSYAAALNRKSAKNMSETEEIDSDYDVVIENERYDNEKENVINTSFFNNTGNESIVEKLSRTVEELVIGDEGHKKKTEPLNKEIEMLKNVHLEPNSSLDNNDYDSTNNSNTDKRFTRCAAHFPVLK